MLDRTMLIQDMLETEKRLARAGTRVSTPRQFEVLQRHLERLRRAWEELALASRDGQPS